MPACFFCKEAVETVHVVHMVQGISNSNRKRLFLAQGNRVRLNRVAQGIRDDAIDLATIYRIRHCGAVCVLRDGTLGELC